MEADDGTNRDQHEVENEETIMDGVIISCTGLCIHVPTIIFRYKWTTFFLRGFNIYYDRCVELKEKNH